MFFKLFLKRCDILRTVGIIAEFNPLHNGHRFLLQEAKKRGAAVCVISGNFVQRGDTALIEKRKRAACALANGADLVLELPVCWSMSTSQNFALGGVSVLSAAGCDGILFGSESGDISALEKTADILSTKRFSKELLRALDSGITFAAARETAAFNCGADSELLSAPNNNLGLEYISAAKRLGIDIEFDTVKRKGTAHDSEETVGNFASASFIRSNINDAGLISRYLPEQTVKYLSTDSVSDIRRAERAILAILRLKTAEDFAALPDLSEGIENKLLFAARNACSLDELYNIIKSKRYTLARIRRLVLSAAIGIDNGFFMKRPPYARVLGFNKTGEKLIKEHSGNSDIPLVLRAGDISALGGGAKKVFDIECRATDLYGLTLKKPLKCGLEYTSKLIKTE